jgi:hypothetical protein
MKEIILTQGQVALVDDEDYEYLNQFKWQAFWSKKAHTFYAHRPIYKGNKRTKILMHRQILNVPDGLQVDHINHKTLDNQKYNLRIVTCRQNNQNHSRNVSSIYPGVSWNKKLKKWQANAVFNGKKHSLGMYLIEIEAFNAYRKFLQSIGEPEIIMPYKISKETASG